MDYKMLLQPRTAKVVQDASFSRRLFSFIIDMLILDLFITGPFTPLFARHVQVSELADITLTSKELAAAVVLLLLIYAYYVLFEYLLGQTPGMMLMNTRLSGNNGIGALLLRNSLFLPLFPFVIMWVIEPVSILLMRRGVLERFSNTRTVYQRDILL